MDKQCSHCLRDLTYGNGVYDQVLKLSDHRISPKPGEAVFDIYILPILDKDLYFCGLGCLKKWCENEKK